MTCDTDKTPKRRGAQGPGRKWGHTCNAVKEGQLLYVFGGYDRDDRQTNDVHVFDAAKRMWSKANVKGVAPSPRYSHTCTTVGNELVVFGGTDGRRPLNDLHILDTDTNSWWSPKAIGDIPDAREGHSCLLFGGRLFVFGGCGRSPHGVGETYFNDLYSLDMGAFVWEKVQTLGTGSAPRDKIRNRFIGHGGGDSASSNSFEGERSSSPGSTADLSNSDNEMDVMEDGEDSDWESGLGPVGWSSRKRQASSNVGPGPGPGPGLRSGPAGYGSQDSIVGLDNLSDGGRDGRTSGKTLRRDARRKQVAETKRRKAAGEGSTNDGRDTKDPVKQEDRCMSDFSWLLLTELKPITHYIPQFEDEVVYFIQGHKKYLDLDYSIGTGPWNDRKFDIRAVEFCKIVGLEYKIFKETGQTCCELTLRFTDESSSMFGESFEVTLPELSDEADFIVEKCLYEVGLRTGFRVGNKCETWWRSDEEAGGGKWLKGSIIDSNASSPEFPDSPWEQFTVLYMEWDSPKRCRRECHSAWEIFEPGFHNHTSPGFDEEDKEYILRVITAVEQHYVEKGHELELRRLVQDVENVEYRNKIPLPLNLEVVKQRVKNDYYRHMMALVRDAQLLCDNTETFHGNESQMTTILRAVVQDLKTVATYTSTDINRSWFLS